MASPLMVAPLLAAHLFTMGHVRELRAQGLVVRAVAHEDSRGVTKAQIEIGRYGETQTVDLGARALGASMLLQSIEIVDANFDGYPDVLVIREFGGKWSRVDALLFDPRTHRFTSSSPLAQSIGRLENATFDARRKTITTRDIGPSEPSRVTYTVYGGHLHEVGSCRFINPVSARVGTLVRKTGARTTVSKLRLGVNDVDPCGP